VIATLRISEFRCGKSRDSSRIRFDPEDISHPSNRLDRELDGESVAYLLVSGMRNMIRKVRSEDPFHVFVGSICG
jgi:hypothetical protein